MKIFTAKQIYAADQFTIEDQNITSDALMERASVQLFNWLHHRLQGAQVKIKLFCGIGNNGGDGLALARHLREHGYNFEVFVVNYSEKRSHDFLTNLERLKDRKIWPNFVNQDTELPSLDPEDIIIDAIFGIGLNRSPAQWVERIIQHLNNSAAFVVSVDVPSGLFLDQAIKNSKAVVRANYVLSFQFPKLIFFLPETGIFSNQWEILNIGLSQKYIEQTEATFELISKNEVLKYYLPREKFSHKGTYGHALILGGSYGKIGAVSLTSRACITSGSGLVSAYVPQCGYIPIQSSLPEVMVITDQGEKEITNISLNIEPNVIGVGIGMGTAKNTLEAFTKFLGITKCPMVIDADGINMIAMNKSLLKKLPPKTILTPHPGELKRLLGSWEDDFDKLQKAREFSKKYDCILVLKDAHTIVIYNKKGYVNTTGNPGMATAGSGDVLTGVITSLIAQKYEPLKAAIFGVYLHGRAGDIAIENLGYQALTATAIINGIGPAYIDLFDVPPADDEKETNEK
ncbi:NAD(P)H-hydrate dehydratase [uncultured Eudoraea sp.]|uniref:NAD(P)H-hydrate dehydratase n=1 Tax=uncultured Eudoraea sp. TaxID=1035614 RepID=UPI0026265848|nr:NAD(P)H-hydrate dehydratase [uncultured Eudoraea sp.]